jgi:hypothetical protein
MYWITVGLMCFVLGTLMRFRLGRIFLGFLELLGALSGEPLSVGRHTTQDINRISKFTFILGAVCFVSAPLTEYVWEYSGLVLGEITVFYFVGTLFYSAYKKKVNLNQR